ncbi:MAG TPA: aldo/keto reductase [Candidatus Acidoferrales bacterium]|nr:aldo/keto reductase [Candidatus Acidoferrales bacterium]
MVPRALGQSGIAVTPIGLGTTKLGRNTDVKYPQPFSLPSDREVRELLETALSLGVNLIDTAPAYGASESRLGSFVQAHRQQIVLCTKCGEQYLGGRSLYDFSKSAIYRSVDESLRRLRTDYVDILLLHSDGRDVEILSATQAPEALAQLKQSGKARAIGISAKTEGGIREACRRLDIVMAPFSQAAPSLAQALAQARAAGLGVLAIKGLDSGHLEPAKAIEFVLGQQFIDALIIGTINPAHLREAVAIAERFARAQP